MSQWKQAHERDEEAISLSLSLLHPVNPLAHIEFDLLQRFLSVSLLPLRRRDSLVRELKMHRHTHTHLHWRVMLLFSRMRQGTAVKLMPTSHVRLQFFSIPLGHCFFSSSLFPCPCNCHFSFCLNYTLSIHRHEHDSTSPDVAQVNNNNHSEHQAIKTNGQVQREDKKITLSHTIGYFSGKHKT